MSAPKTLTITKVTNVLDLIHYNGFGAENNRTTMAFVFFGVAETFSFTGMVTAGVPMLEKLGGSHSGSALKSVIQNVTAGS